MVCIPSSSYAKFRCLFHRVSCSLRSHGGYQKRPQAYSRPNWFVLGSYSQPKFSCNALRQLHDVAANSNIIALLATLLVRFFVGPLVDRYGPRKVMAGLLLIGAIPSGLAGTANSANALYAIRFFIGDLLPLYVVCKQMPELSWFHQVSSAALLFPVCT
jgi:MFS family permease